VTYTLYLKRELHRSMYFMLHVLSDQYKKNKRMIATSLFMSVIMNQYN